MIESFSLHRGALPRAGLALCLSAVMAAPAFAEKPRPHVEARLVAEVQSIQPGHPFWVGLRLEAEPEWHTYWKNPGDSGLATRLDWRLPEGFSAGPLEWPAPQRIPAKPLMSYGYEGVVLLPTRITPPPDLAPGSVRLEAKASWLECRQICLPGKADLSLELPVRTEPAARDPQWAPLFETTRDRLPARPDGWRYASAARDGRVVLWIEPPAGTVAPKQAYFFSAEPEVLDYAAPQTLLRLTDGFGLRLAPATNPKPFAGLEGVLVADGKSLRVEAPVSERPLPAVAAVATPPASGSGPGLWLALGLAFLGGMILNLMPCVLPVLSLKVLSFVRHGGQDRRASFRHGLAFTVGVVAFFWVLAGAMLALRATGEQIGWGFQLQSPPFVVFLAALFLLLSLNLFGVFEVGESLTTLGNLGAGSSGYASSFWSGALATLVATPCTAPFMGSALGFALGQSAAVALLVFTALGLGMAFPYLVLARFPRLLKVVPKPGPWMETFKQLMGFLLVGTVLFLVWLFGRQAGLDALGVLMAGLLVIAAGGWLYGRGTRPETGTRRRRLSVVFAAGLIVAGLVLGLTRARASSAPARSVQVEDGIRWEPYSAERLASLRKQGRPVFVDFTADWCLTCQVNERLAFGSPEVRRRFRKEGVAMLRADWTLRDDAITRALASYGRQGVPLYVLYGRDPAAPPELLPEVLNASIVLEALDRTF